ncbi:hypothetical protein MNEG_14938 [Monoraphidium neglectum]|uniref:Zinc-finger domain-containing protein n=1 Tax=Monoraphidium neglectum TaxID=145388 RepID=A0A0D2MCN8_9CHLO|nr:hypothetical protein MNEG_14938 [Monoraphidium neglectum]KIY93025.1 hypothetical protein MNEG_14938 [Monoraphidium neglectum]|eukprot:XP_013892045.1 hypothetical protein MNEG_14938 [Monoraphidium neglectum]
MYDQHVGITCHFCRQKKLCGEEGCPRCSRRSATADCIGKTECGKCHSATGRFCRACLLLRYGQTMEEAMAQMKAGTWLCPHCYEHEHPSEGWMCNSSICMKRRGFAPTGIAIYDAQKRGFQSVAHWLQAQLKKRGEGGASSSGVLDAGAPAAAAKEGDRAAAGGERKRGRPRKDPVLAAAGKGAGKGAAAAGGAEGDQADPDDGQRRTRARASAAAAAVVAVQLKSKGQKAAAAADKDTAPAKDAGPKAARKAAAPKAARAAAAGPKKGGSGAEALSSREGSSEPFAPPTPAKPELAEANKGAGPRRALRPRRV